MFKHKNSNTFLIADAYDGEYIKLCTQQFLQSCAGMRSDSVKLKNGTVIYIAGNADLLAYIGHDGLMDFSIVDSYKAADTLNRQAIILACISKNYFAPLLKPTMAEPLVWTTGLMCPEAYTLHDAIEAWLLHKPAENIRTNAALAYSHYQSCSLKAAKNLLVTGW